MVNVSHKPNLKEFNVDSVPELLRLSRITNRKYSLVNAIKPRDNGYGGLPYVFGWSGDHAYCKEFATYRVRDNSTLIFAMKADGKRDFHNLVRVLEWMENIPGMPTFNVFTVGRYTTKVFITVPRDYEWREIPASFFVNALRWGWQKHLPEEITFQTLFNNISSNSYSPGDYYQSRNIRQNLHMLDEHPELIINSRYNMGFIDYVRYYIGGDYEKSKTTNQTITV